MDTSSSLLAECLILPTYVSGGILLGMLVLYPPTAAALGAAPGDNLLWVYHRLFLAGDPLLCSLAGGCVLLGATLGLVAGRCHQTVRRIARDLERIEHEIHTATLALLLHGEHSHPAISSSLRRPHAPRRTHRMRADETACLRVKRVASAGDVASDGGVLLLGIYRDGRIMGLESRSGVPRYSSREPSLDHLIRRLPRN